MSRIPRIACRFRQEKNKLIVDLKRLKNHYSNFEPMLQVNFLLNLPLLSNIRSIFPQSPSQMMRAKYETAMKEKMLMKLERDRLASRVAALEAQLRQLEDNRPPEEVISANQPSSALTSPHRPLSLLIW